MAEPQRIRLSRTIGWRKPAGAVVVTRPGPWGNPFRVGTHGDAATCVEKYHALVTGLIDTATQPCPDYATQLNAQIQVRDHLNSLRGHDLACWCALDAPCHADVLLALAKEAKNG
jgi:Domain of unknown function (DUF4326)